MSAPRRGKRSKSDAPEARTPVTVSDVAPAPDLEPAPEPETAMDDAAVEAISGAGEIDAATAPDEDAPADAPESDAIGEEGESSAGTSDEELAALSALSADDEAAPATPSDGDDTPALRGDASAAPPSGGLSREKLKTVLESLVFVADHTVTPQQLARMVKAKQALVRELLEELIEDYRERGIALVEVAGGFQFRSAASSADYVREFVAQRPVRLTRAQLETLALIAYRQPITRPEIDEVRGVDSGSAVRVLLERELIKMLGRKDEPGRPLLYGSTPYFLEFFGMRSLKDLPTLREFTELNEENRALFKRKTGEEVGDAEAALAAAEEAARLDGEQAAHISDEDLAALAAQEDLARAEEAAADDSEPPPAERGRAPDELDAPDAPGEPSEPMSDADADAVAEATES